MDTKISKHTNDIIQKYAAGLFRNATLKFYGIDTAPIRELINPELPKIEVAGGSADMVFLLADDSYLHFEFSTGFDNASMIKSAGYNLRLYERDGRKIRSVIIYTADVNATPEGLNIGSLVYNPDVIMMGDYDGGAVFAELEAKIKSGSVLSELDVLNLVLLPLMRHTLPRKELAVKTVELAQAITDTTKKNAVIAAAIGFASKYLKSDEIENILEVLKMTDIGAMLVRDGKTEEKMDIARKLLKRGISIDAVTEDTGLEVSVVERLRADLSNELVTA